MLDLKKFAEQLVNLNIKQVNELSEILKKEYNIQPDKETSSSTNKEEKAVEKKTNFDLVLTSIGNSKLAVVKLVKEFTGLGLRESKELVEAAPKTIKKDLNEKEANNLKEKFESIGASVELK